MTNQADTSTGTFATLQAILAAVADGRISPHQALQQVDRLAREPFEELNFAKVDHDRLARQGFPEVVFGQGKTPEQIASIAEAIVGRGHSLLITRTDAAAHDRVAKVVPDARFHDQARIIERRLDGLGGNGVIMVAAAGTSDIPVAEEAAVSAEVMGHQVDRVYDVGVAGLHRLLSATDRLRQARVVIAVAGMEGALPSVIGGLVGVPVIAVPTSVGYGSSLGGLTALFAMLNSCAAGVSVVNIDNGFGAAAAAHRIAHASSTRQA